MGQIITLYEVIHGISDPHSDPHLFYLYTGNQQYKSMSVRMKQSLHGANVVGSIYLLLYGSASS